MNVESQIQRTILNRAYRRIQPDRGIYSIEAWTQPASLKKRGGTKIMYIFVKIGGGGKN